jgi:hypothetical protein
MVGGDVWGGRDVAIERLEGIDKASFKEMEMEFVL